MPALRRAQPIPWGPRLTDNLDLPEDFPPGMAEFFPLIGRFIVGWSRIEKSIDMINLQARHYDDKFKGTHVQWSEKLDAFKRIAERNPKLTASRNWLAPQFEHLETGGRIRHTLVHGYCEGLISNEPPTVRFRKEKYKKGMRDAHEVDVTLESLASALRIIRALDQQLMFVLMAVGPNIEVTNSDDHRKEE